MKDGYGRTIDYLRMSVTDRCNLKCRYCMPEGGVRLLPESELLTDDELVRIAEAAARAGIAHIKITGGEPLLRKNVAALIRRIRSVDGIDTVTLTTNGIFLRECIGALYRAGISGINISLDTLDEARYERMTRGGNLKKALDGLESALAYPGITLKVNAVLAEACWKEDALALTELAEKERIHVRFIEHMPLGEETARDPVLERDILKLLKERYGDGVPCEEKIGEGPGRYYAFPKLRGRIGFISAMSHKFCSGCNRIRLTSDGKLRLCLQSREGLPLKEMLREGISDDTLTEILTDGIYKKPREHQMEAQKIEAEGMCQIGG